MREIHSAHVSALADRIAADIRHRGLAVGDRYLTTEEVSRMLGVRKAVAGQAVRHLAKREILIPRQRAGTFVGPGLKKQSRSKVQTIFVLLPAGDPSGSHWAYQPFIAGIRNAIPDANVQFTFIPEGDPLPYVQELIDIQRASGHFLGVVAVSCPPEVYRYLSDLRVPAVVSGTLYSSELQLTSVDLDSRHTGRLLTQHLVDQGHRRIALLTTGAGRPGDNEFLDGVIDALSTAGLAPNTLIQRSVRNDIEALQAIARELMKRSDRPTAYMTRGSFQVAAVAEAASILGLRVPDDVEIVFDHMDETTPSIDVTLFPRVQAKLPFVEHAAMIGRILKEMSEGIRPYGERVVIPIEFHHRASTATQTSNGD